MVLQIILYADHYLSHQPMSSSNALTANLMGWYGRDQKIIQDVSKEFSGLLLGSIER